jgi:DedD protein
MNGSSKDRRSAGWISTLVALVVLVVVGFLCGALAGFLWEEPGLVVAYLSGKTEPVEWSETNEPAPVAAAPPALSESAELAADSAPQPAAAEAPAEPEPEPEPEAKPVPPPAPAALPAPARVKPAEKKPAAPKPNTVAKPAEKPATAKVAAATPAGRFSVQVGAFADRASADKLASRLRSHGYDTFVKTDGEAGGKRFRVRVGPVAARSRAEELAAKLAKGEKLPTWILDESKG